MDSESVTVEDAIEFTYSNTSHRSIMVAGADLRSLAKATNMSVARLMAKFEDGELLDEETTEDEDRVAAIRTWLEENENRLGETTDQEDFADLQAV